MLLEVEDIVFNLLKHISKECKYARLILEECLTNIIKYSEKEETTIVIHFPKTEKGLCVSVVLMDNGKPFNLLEYPQKGTDIWTIGGKGIFLIKEFSKSIDYEYKEKQNVLTIQFI